MNSLAPGFNHLWDVAGGVGVGAHLIDIAFAVVPAAQGVHERGGHVDVRLLLHHEFLAAGQAPQIGVIAGRFPGLGPVGQIVVLPDVDHLVQGADVGVPEGGQFGVLLPHGMALLEASLKLSGGTGFQGVGT